MKQCTKCKETKELTEFNKDRDKKDGYCTQCRACKTEYKRRNKKRIDEKNAQYRIENREKMRAANRKWKEERAAAHYAKPEVKEHYRKYRRDWMRNRRKEDPAFKLQGVVSRAVWGALNGREKSSRTFDALPYTPEQLKEHLESQFEDWMSWDNYGEWEVDHIYPQSLLPYDSLDHPNFQRCWALENLQPLGKIENIKKSNKILDHLQ